MTALATEPSARVDQLLSFERALSRTVARVEISVLDPVDWTGSLVTRRLGALEITDEACDPVTVHRVPASVLADPRRHVLARLQLEGAVRVTQDGRTAELAPGSLAFVDLARPFRVACPERQRARLLVVPRSLLGLDERALHHVTAIALGACDGGLAALLLPLLAGIAQEIGEVAPPVQDQLARTAADLLALLAADRSSRLPAARPAAQSLFERITGSVEASLGDPDLSPQAIADRHGVSLRYLHQLFQRQGTTVSGWIRNRRLHGAYQELARPGAARREISAVAAHWGFTSASHFSRAFRDAYGMSPIQWRTKASVRGLSAGGARGGN